MSYLDLDPELQSFIQTIQSNRYNKIEITLAIAITLAYQLPLEWMTIEEAKVMFNGQKTALSDKLDILLSYITIDYKEVLDLILPIYLERLEFAYKPMSLLKLTEKVESYLPKVYLEAMTDKAYFNIQYMTNSFATLINRLSNETLAGI